MARLRERIARFRSASKRFGFRRTLAMTGLALAYKYLDLTSIVVLVLTEDGLRPEFREELEGYEFRWATDRDIATCIDRPGYEMTEDFAQQALSAGDRCYVVVSGEVPACYVWFSSRITEAFPGVDFEFATDWAYAYSGYTLDDHRGRRLLGRVLTRGAADLIAGGKSQVITIIEARNLASLAGTAVTGFERIGHAWILNSRRRFWSWHRRDPAHANWGFREGAGRG